LSVGFERRRELIIERARRHGYVSVDALAAEFAVTPQTIRRDINELCEQDLLQRYHGGAGLPSSVENVAYPDRKDLHRDAKRKIAALCARHVPNHASLFINIGTTTEEVARALMGHLELKVVTNNLQVASLMSAEPGFEVIVTGGLVRSRDRGIVGEAAIDLIRQFRVDIAVIGISGIDLDGSLLDFDYREVRVAQAIIANARRVFLVTDHSKFGRTAMVRLGHVGQIHALFTDRVPPESIAAALREANVELHVTDAELSSAA
jgi:DeoR family transcriptional regulator, glycerol-3-phosphate regulon repressor